MLPVFQLLDFALNATVKASKMGLVAEASSRTSLELFQEFSDS